MARGKMTARELREFEAITRWMNAHGAHQAADPDAIEAAMHACMWRLIVIAGKTEAKDVYPEQPGERDAMLQFIAGAALGADSFSTPVMDACFCRRLQLVPKDMRGKSVPPLQDNAGARPPEMQIVFDWRMGTLDKAEAHRQLSQLLGMAGKPNSKATVYAALDEMALRVDSILQLLSEPKKKSDNA